MIHPHIDSAVRTGIYSSDFLIKNVHNWVSEYLSTGSPYTESLFNLLVEGVIYSVVLNKG